MPSALTRRMGGGDHSTTHYFLLPILFRILHPQPHTLAEPQEDLKREITLWGLSANIINIMIGAGIFVLPAIVAAELGSMAFLAYLLCGFLVSLVMLCFAEAGSRVTVSGSAYSYIERAFGPFWGFLAGNIFILGAMFADAAVANAITDILASFFPVFSQTLWRTLFIIFLFSFLTAINVIGIKQGIGLVKFITVVKLLPMLILITAGWTGVESSNFAIQEMPTMRSLTQVSLLLFFAFQGAESALTVTGEVKKPNRTIPRAIFVAILVALIIYMLLQFVSQGVLGDELGNYTEGPLAEVAGRVFGPTGFLVLTFAAAISMFGNLSSEVMSMPRMLYSAARDGILPPRQLANIHPRFRTPYIAIMAYAAAGCLLAIIGGFEVLAIMSSAYVILLYLGVVISIFRLRKITESGPDIFQMPGGNVIPVLAILVMCVLLFGLKPEELIGGGLSIIALAVIYIVMKKIRR